MADYPAPVPAPASETRQPPATGALVAYILFGIAALVGFAGHGFLSLVGIVGVIVAYVSRGDLRGTWAESHLTWLIRTFWWSLLWNVIGGVVVAYVSRTDQRGTWAESHLGWLIRTFWWSLVWTCIGWLVFFTFIGIPIAWVIWVATAIWVIYRGVRGFLLFNDRRPIPAM